MKEIIKSEIKKDLLNLLKYKTIKDNFKEINELIEYVKKELNNYKIKEINVGDYKNIVISNTEDKNLDIIFCGHIDVVPCDSYEYYEKDGKVFGRGTFDMKGQVASLMSLFKFNNSKNKIALILTSDEEIGGYCCKKIMEEYNSSLAVIPDAGKDFNLIIEEKGLLQIEITSKGVTSHASEPYKGINPIIKLMDIYYKLIEKYNMPKDENDFKTSINLSKINGGKANNMVPSDASMVLDIRFTKEDKPEDIINYIKNISNDINIKVLDIGPVFSVNHKLKSIKKFLYDASKILNIKIEIKKCVATSDAIYFSEKNIPAILMNPKGDYWHNPKEYVELDSLYTLYEIFKTLL